MNMKDHNNINRIISIDVESNGLDGTAFSVAAIVYDYKKTNYIFSYTAICQIVGEVDEFVKNNVLDSVNYIENKFDTLNEMLIDFDREVMQKYYNEDSIIIAHMPYPVETNFLNELKKVTNNSFIHFYDVATMLFLIGKNPYSIDSYIKEKFKDIEIKEHDPKYDAEAALTVFLDILDDGLAKKGENMKKKILIIHHNDTDGRYAANIVLRNVIEGDIEPKIVCLETNYIDLESKLKELDDLDEFTDCYIVDVSFTKDSVHIYNKLKENINRVIWIDHHDSSIELIEDGTISEYEGIISKEKCGAFLTYIWFKYDEDVTSVDIQSESTDIQSLLLVDDYDRHTEQYGGTNSLQYFILSQEHQSPISEMWMLIEKEDEIDNCIQKGNIVFRYVGNNAAKKYKESGCIKKYKYTGNTYTICILNSLDHTSLVIPNYIDADFGVVWHYSEISKTYSYSIYSTKESKFDCKKFCQEHGGGGHIHAAGFSSDRMVFS